MSHEVLTWQGVSKMQEDLTTMVSQQLQTAQSNEAAAKTSLDQALKSHDAALVRVKKDEKEKEELRGSMWLLQERLKGTAQEAEDKVKEADSKAAGAYSYANEKVQELMEERAEEARYFKLASTSGLVSVIFSLA